MSHGKFSLKCLNNLKKKDPYKGLFSILLRVLLVRWIHIIYHN